MKKYDLMFCCLGNGVTVANKALHVGGDYETIAHISPAGNVHYYISPEALPREALDKIEASAAREKENTKTAIEERLNYSKIATFGGDEYRKYIEKYERGRILEEISKYTTLDSFNSFWGAYTAAQTTQEKNAVIVDFYLSNF